MSGVLVSEMPDWRDRVKLIQEQDPGFSTRFASVYEQHKQREYESGIYDPAFLEFAHSHGFTGQAASAYALNEDNISDYLSDYDYYKTWPQDSWQRIWINDKLTLKLILDGTEWESLLPEYYFYTEYGTIRAMPGSPYQNSVTGLADCLKDKLELASKPCNGIRCQGFHKLGYDVARDVFLIDENELRDESELGDFIATHQNYLITEYLNPVDYLAAIHPLIHTLRVLVARVDDSFEVLGGYLRFGSMSAQGNYNIPGVDSSNYTVGVDINTGAFGHGKLTYANRMEETSYHPGTGVLCEGVLQDWESIKAVAIEVAKTLGFVEYLGFDFGLTDKGLRMMEINSSPGIMFIQLFYPVNKTPLMAKFFNEKLRQVDELDAEAAKKRQSLVR